MGLAGSNLPHYPPTLRERIAAAVDPAYCPNFTIDPAACPWRCRLARWVRGAT